MTQTLPEPPLLTIQDLAAHLQVPVRTIQKWRETSKGPQAIRVGRHLRWRAEDVSRWLDEQAAER